jgi:hypothetical protein
MHVMAGLLVVGFIANFLVKPVASKYWLPESAPPSDSGSLH